ncbi:MAG: OmpP1/FadL family transporter [Chitinophagaceae bacterium]
MKKLALLFVTGFLGTTLIAQEPSDALRFSWTNSNGTARQQSIGGAMASLGGDLSAAFINPAGLGFYRTGDLIISPGFNQLQNKSTYYGTTVKDNRASIGFGTTGFVVGTATEPKGSLAFAVAINRSAWFGNNLLSRGANTQNSYSQKFLEEIAGQGDANIVAQNYPFGSSLAFNTFWIDTINGGSPGNYQYQSRAPIGNLLQENVVTSRGGISELAIALAGSKNEKLFYGFTLGMPFLNYTRETEFTEADKSTYLNNFDFATLSESLHTKGNGLNLKAGIIYRPAPQWRFGLSIHSPTYLKLTDTYSASVTTNTENYMGTQTQRSSDVNNGYDGNFSYYHFTPYRLMIGGSYVIREVEDITQQKGFLTADLEYVNYRASSYKTDPEQPNSSSAKAYFNNLNKAIDNAYKGAFNLRVGGELKFTTLMTRLGLAVLGNPYENIVGEKGSRLQLTGGLGYRDKGYFIDLAYVHTLGTDVHYAYRLSQSPFAGATLKQTGSRVLLSFGVKF